MAKKIKDLTGMQFGRLLVKSLSTVRYYGRAMWLCLCSCGNAHTVRSSRLLDGSTRSCGCLRRERMQARNIQTKHGMHKTPEYAAFHGAKKRCNNPKCKAYPDYGGRGIEFRFNSFDEWLNALGAKPSPEMSVDRIDNNGHYEVGNVRWSTKTEQANNRRPKYFSTLNGSHKQVLAA